MPSATSRCCQYWRGIQELTSLSTCHIYTLTLWSAGQGPRGRMDFRVEPRSTWNSSPKPLKRAPSCDILLGSRQISLVYRVPRIRTYWVLLFLWLLCVQSDLHTRESSSSWVLSSRSKHRDSRIWGAPYLACLLRRQGCGIFHRVTELDSALEVPPQYTCMWSCSMYIAFCLPSSIYTSIYVYTHTHSCAYMCVHCSVLDVHMYGPWP